MQKRNSRDLLCLWCDVSGADHCIIGTGHGYACTAKSIDESTERNSDETVSVRSQCICREGEESCRYRAAGHCKR